MKYVNCNENEASHIRLPISKSNKVLTVLGLSLNNEYSIILDTLEFNKGERMIVNESNTYLYIRDFPMYFDVEWLKLS